MTVETVAEGIVNSLWRGLALWAVAALLVRVAGRNSAATRHAVWYASLVAILAVSAAGFRIPTSPPAPPQISAAPPDAGPLPAPTVEPWNWRPRVSLPPLGLESLSAVFALWLGMAGTRLLLLGFGYRRVLELKRKSRPVADVFPVPAVSPVRRRVEARQSGELTMPVLAGLRKPAVVFPTQLLRQLPGEDIARIWLHELAHVRRWDDWLVLGQRVAEAALFFHPAARWIGKRLDLEREIACDDWVVAVSGSVRPYAACLARLAALVSEPSPAVSAPGMAADRKQIFRRMEMLLDRNKERRAGFSPLAAVAAAGVLFAAVILFAQAGPLFAVADEQSDRAVVEKRVRELHDEMRPLQDEIRKAKARIQDEAQKNIAPNTAEIEKLATEIREQVNTAIRPNVAEINRLARQIGERRASGEADTEAVRKLEEQIRRIEGTAMRGAERRIQELESRIEAQARMIGPSEKQIQALEQKIQELSKTIEMRAREIEKLQSAPPAPPAPPAKPIAPTAPAAPAAPLTHVVPPAEPVAPPAAPVAPPAAPVAAPAAPAQTPASNF